MALGNKIELLVYTTALFVLVGTDFIMQIDPMFKDIDVLLLVGALIYFFAVVSIAVDKWKYLGLIAAFMVWTGTYCIFAAFLSFIDSEPSTYSRIFNPLYVFFGVFGGIRMYCAWLANNRAKQEEEA